MMIYLVPYLEIYLSPSFKKCLDFIFLKCDYMHLYLLHNKIFLHIESFAGFIGRNNY